MNRVDRSSHHCFLIRIWHEPDAVAGLPQWRGSVKRLAEEQTHYFAQLDELLAYIAQTSVDGDALSSSTGLK